MITSLQKYKLACWLFQRKEMNLTRHCGKNQVHSHHIKPKAKYPKLAKDYRNIVDVPPILHAVLHHWLHNAYLEAGDNESAERFDVASNIIDFINDRDDEHTLNADDIQLFADEYWRRIMSVVGSIYWLGERVEFLLRLKKNFKYYTERRTHDRIPVEKAKLDLVFLDWLLQDCSSLWDTDEYLRERYSTQKSDMLDFTKEEIDDIIRCATFEELGKGLDTK